MWSGPLTLPQHRTASRAVAPDTVTDTVPVGPVDPSLEYVVLDDGELCVRDAQRFDGYLDPKENVGRFMGVGVGERPVPRWEVFRDKPFVLFAALNALLVMHDGIATVVLPLWIAERTNAPVAVYAVILLLNTVMVVLFQVRASRGSADVAGGVRALRTSGVLLAGCRVHLWWPAGPPARR